MPVTNEELLGRLVGIEANVGALAQHVEKQNGRIGRLEAAQNYARGAADTLASVRDGHAWRLPALTAFGASVFTSILGGSMYFLLEHVFH